LDHNTEDLKVYYWLIFRLN